MYRVTGLLILFTVAYAKHEIYDGHSLYEVTVKNVAQTTLLHELTKELDLDTWSHALPSKPGSVLVPKQLKDEFEYKMKMAGVSYKIELENIKEALELEDSLLASKPARNFNSSKLGLPFDRIYTYYQIDAYIDALGAEYPHLVTVVNAGKSYEGRDIKYLRISTTNFQDHRKPVVFMESLLHAREWITQAATLYAIHKLVIDITEHDLLTDIDWIILPVANPDGFEYTQEQRFWRKNRSTGHIIGNICQGVDLNRNFDAYWSTASSNMACSDTFHGPTPTSEPETDVIRNIFNQYGDRMELFLDIHSFGSWILYGYGNGVLPPQGLMLHLVGITMAHAIDAVKESFNPDYVVGNVALILYEASGSAQDFAMISGVPLSYTFELPGFRLGGSSALGFLVDPDFIEQAGFETWEGIKAGARMATRSYKMRRGL